MTLPYLSLTRIKIISILFICCFFVLVPGSHAQTIFTVAGSGEKMSTVGYWGDGGLAINASTPYTDDVCIDEAGNLYLTCVNSIRRVDAATGIISIVAGNGTPMDSGDSGLAVNAGMRSPDGLCLDKKGNLYVTEYLGHTVRKINLLTGIITTVAGNGTQGFSGDDGPAVTAQLNTPNGICVDDSDNLYIADCYNGRIRKVNQSSGIITTLSTAYYPNSICIDKAGNIYTTQTTYVYKFDPVAGSSSVVAGNGVYAYSGDGGAATEASLFDASGVCVDAAGNIYISEYDDSRIRKVDHQTGIITTIAGTGNNGFSGDYGPLLNAGLYYPLGLISDGKGNLYVCDNQNSRIRKIATLTCFWTGAADNKWENALNWSGGNIPGNDMNVIIATGNISINSNVIIQSLTVNPGASVTVTSPYTLKLLSDNSNTQ
jgi:trimeric autotransporter adhesin